MDTKLTYTGERMMEEASKTRLSYYLIYVFRIATYDFSKEFVKENIKVDLICVDLFGDIPVPVVPLRFTSSSLGSDS